MNKALPRKKIDKIAKISRDGYDFVYKLYAEILPEFKDENVKKIEGYPLVSINTSKYLWKKAIEIDTKKEKDADYKAGELWLNRGFGTSEEKMPDWFVDLSKIKMSYDK